MSITLNECSFHHNTAPRYGGTIQFDGKAGTNCTDMKKQKLLLINTNISDSNVTKSGAAIHAKCIGIESYLSRFSNNKVEFDTDGASTKSACGNDASDDSDCYENIANYISDSYGGSGAAIYAYNTDLNISNCTFENNKVNVGNGGAIYREINFEQYFNESYYNGSLASLYANNITFELIIANNSFANNTVGSIIDTTDSDFSCTDISGLSGFGGAIWLDLKEDFTNIYYTRVTKDTILIENNTFSLNNASFLKDIYFNLYYYDTLNTMNLLQNLSQTNVFDISSKIVNDSATNPNATTTTAQPTVSTSFGSSPINITNLKLTDSVEGDDSISCDENCLGFVLPGNLFQITYKFEDYWKNPSDAISSCPQITYAASKNYVELQDISIDMGENDVELLLTVDDARYDTRIFINLTDLHSIIDANDTSSLLFNVITTLCAIGSEVDIYSQGETICSLNNMTGVSFSCESTCSGSQYLFTRWEWQCHDCPSLGATCSGDNEVVLDYAYYGLVTTSPTQHENNVLCVVEIDTYLCPSDLCCTDLAGCSFNNTDDSVLCAKNRDASIPFCGKCIGNFSEVYGSYICSDECGKYANKNNLYLVIIPIIGCMLLLFYFLFAKDPYSATPLFGYVFKSSLFFY